MSLSIENLKESDEVLCDEESFSTEQLFSFALQIAKGMVNTIIFWITLQWSLIWQNDGQNRECILLAMIFKNSIWFRRSFDQPFFL